MDTSAKIVLVIFILSEMTALEGVREGANLRNVRPTRRPENDTSYEGGGVTVLAYIIPGLICIVFFLLICCCCRMTRNTETPEVTAENQEAQGIGMRTSQEDNPYNRGPPSYNSLPVLGQESPPPTYEDFVSSQKINLKDITETRETPGNDTVTNTPNTHSPNQNTSENETPSDTIRTVQDTNTENDSDPTITYATAIELRAMSVDTTEPDSHHSEIAAYANEAYIPTHEELSQDECRPVVINDSCDHSHNTHSQDNNYSAGIYESMQNTAL